MIPLTYEENTNYKRQASFFIFQKEFNTDENDENAFELYHKVRDHYYYSEIIEELLIMFVI